MRRLSLALTEIKRKTSVTENSKTRSFKINISREAYIFIFTDSVMNIFIISAFDELAAIK